MSKTVVLGGTFNPLTKAHVYILKKAAKLVHADKMILLPANKSFFKSWKNFNNEEIMNNEIRLKILNEFQKRNKNVLIETLEIDNLSFKTYTSLKMIKEKYNFDEVYFICGSEKLLELNRWFKINDLLKEFKLIIFRRNNDDLEVLKRNCMEFNNFKSSFLFLEDTKNISFISSTKIRELIKINDYDSINKYTFKYIVNILKKGNLYES